jgi:hypothetical protein
MLSYSFCCKKSCIFNLQETTKMKRFLAAMALACVLSVSALAGDVPTSGFAPSPPPPQTANATSFGETSASAGEIPPGDLAQPTIADEVILNVLEILSGGYLSIY